MLDAIFADPRLAAIYDPLDPDRSDLDAYVQIAAEFTASAVVDVGCGTGTLCLLLAQRGLRVVGVDPAAASIDVARSKPGAESVHWILGEVSALPPMQVDLAFMTGNVAQVFITDDDWLSTIRSVHAALRPGGRFVFETRNPARHAWLRWTREHTHAVRTIPGVGSVTSWCDLLDVSGPLVSFRWTYDFAGSDEVTASDSTVISDSTVTSDSTLRFRSRGEVEESLAFTGYSVDEIRDAPDRPGLEFVFVARKPGPSLGT